jgi:hypothetical protein
LNLLTRQEAAEQINVAYVPGKVLDLRTSINFPLMLPVSLTDRIFVLTGAGVSAESGIPTFRGVNGLYHWVSEPGTGSRYSVSLSATNQTGFEIVLPDFLPITLISI